MYVYSCVCYIFLLLHLQLILLQPLLSRTAYSSVSVLLSNPPNHVRFSCTLWSLYLYRYQSPPLLLNSTLEGKKEGRKKGGGRRGCFITIRCEILGGANSFNTCALSSFVSRFDKSASWGRGGEGCRVRVKHYPSPFPCLLDSITPLSLSLDYCLQWDLICFRVY